MMEEILRLIGMTKQALSPLKRSQRKTSLILSKSQKMKKAIKKTMILCCPRFLRGFSWAKPQVAKKSIGSLGMIA